jgi:membrane protein YdbS with pleckstrin-like domain
MDAQIHPTLKFIRLGYAAVAAAVVAAAVASYMWLPAYPWLPAVPLVLLVWPAQRHLRRRLTKVTVTGDKLRYESGFLSKSTRTIQLTKVQDVRVDQTLEQRMFGVGNLSIETAGETSRLTVVNIDGPQEVADAIMEAAQSAGRGTGA